ncbi:MAG: hypothetical protein R3B09_13195 [Nannocystaceae bacterium]
MASSILTAATPQICAHGGNAAPLVTSPRVRIAGAPAVTVASPHAVAGCPLPPAAPPGPCVVGLWRTGAVKVRIAGLPAAIQGGASICTPTGAPLQPLAPQPKVRGA